MRASPSRTSGCPRKTKPETCARWELDGDPFFVATLFQPERAALRGEVPAIVAAFVRAAAGAARRPAD